MSQKIVLNLLFRVGANVFLIFYHCDIFVTVTHCASI